MATQNIEKRIVFSDAVELRAEGNGPPSIVGYAAVFGRMSENLGGFREVIKKGAFKRSIREGADVRALVDHDPSKILGRTTSGTLKLKEDEAGLLATITPPDTSVGRDIVESIRRGDVSQMSFAFATVKDQWEFDQDGPDTRTLIDVDLFDVSAVTYPAYPDTSIAVRSRDVWLADETPRRQYWKRKIENGIHCAD